MGGCDLLLTDPPYGIDCALSTGNHLMVGNETLAIRDWALAHSFWKSAAVFGSPKAAKPDGTIITLVWSKGPFVGMGDLSFPWKLTHEEIYILGSKEIWAGNRLESVIRIDALYPNLPGANKWRGEMLQHPTQKPLSLIELLILKTVAETICDPFMGSGTTLVAAKNLGRKAIGIEIEERYCEIAAKRLSQEVFAFQPETTLECRDWEKV
jgi:site-specific DNA-methyltransferase (adenine-specific)